MAEGSDRGGVVIVGAGFAGLALGCSLLRAGRSVTILERRPELPAAGAAVGIQPNGLAALERLGLLEQALAAGSRTDRIVFHNKRGRVVARVRYGELKHPHPFMLQVRRQDLLRVLADEAMRLAPGCLRFGTEVTGLLRFGGAVRGVHCATDGGEEDLQALCVAGADGIRSKVRDELQIPLRTWSGGQRYVVGIGARPAGLEDGEAWVFEGTGYADGVMPLGDGAYFYNGVTVENAAAVAAQSVDRWRRAYTDRIPPGAEVAAPIATWDELGVLEARPQRAVRRTHDGAALLGDAAAVVHPHSAQGANLALEDGVALGDVLAALDEGRLPSAGDLGRYERLRGRKAARYVAWSRFVGQSFDGAHVGWRLNRWFGWQWNKLPPTRRMLLKFAAGLRYG